MSNWVQLGQDINGNAMQEQIGRSLAISGDGIIKMVNKNMDKNMDNKNLNLAFGNINHHLKVYLHKNSE